MKRHWFLLLSFVVVCAHAQDQTSTQEKAPEQAATQTPAPASTPSAQPAGEANRAISQPQPKAKTNDRVFFMMPNFLTLEQAGHVPPLTPAQKFKLTAQGTFDPFTFGLYAVTAGIAQAENSEPSFGQGAEGYAKRYGIRLADGVIENFMAHAVFTSFLHQDPRYYQLGKGRFMHRLGYAVSRIVITHSDSGATQFNFSEILGSGSAATLSTYTYHPQIEHNFGDVANVWVTQIGYDALGFVLKEFWPDMRRKLRRSKADQAQ